MCSESKKTKADQKYSSPNSAPQNHKHKQKKKQGVQWSHFGLAIFTLKKYHLKAQEEL
jgi:hypothetical protein